MPFTSSDKILPEVFAQVLNTLKIYLGNIPEDLPEMNGATSHYASFLSLSLDINLCALSDMVATTPVIEELALPVHTMVAVVPIHENDWCTYKLRLLVEVLVIA